MVIHLIEKSSFSVGPLTCSDLRIQSLNPGTRLEQYQKLIDPTRMISESDEDMYLTHEFRIRNVLHRAKETRQSTFFFLLY